MRGLYQKLHCDTNENMFQIKDNVEVPECVSGEVKVAVRACALTTTNTQAWINAKKKIPDSSIPVGSEIAGVIVGTGPGVDFLNDGDHVTGLLPPDSQSSGCSEFCVTSQHNLVKLPREVPFNEAAATVGDGVKAYTALYYLGHMTSGDTILVLNGASPFGAMCVQIAQLWGAKVLATAGSEEDKTILEKMNPPPAHVIEVDEKGSILTTSIMEETGGTGVDVVIDSGVRLFASEDDMTKTGEMADPRVPHKHDIISCLAVGGRWVTSRSDLQLDPPDSQRLFLRGASVSFLFEHAWTLSNAHQGRYQHILHDLVEKLASKQLRPPAMQTVSVENAVDALSKTNPFKTSKTVVTL